VTYWQDRQNWLQELCKYERIGLITDMDGTLAPIVPVPSDARPTERNRQLLQQLYHELALVAVVSGRAAVDVRERVDLPDLIYAGNHGLERWQDGQVIVAPAVKPYLAGLRAALQAIEPHMQDAMLLENKQATLSIHYRNVENPERVKANLTPILEGIAQDNNLRLFHGRRVFEVRPPIEMNKGTIFKQLIGEYRLDAALFIGDDTTDADALKMAQTLRKNDHCFSLGIGVQSDDTPALVRDSSDLLVAGVSGVEAFLSWLLEACSAS